MLSLEVFNVSKKIRGKTILSNVSFTVNKGDIFGFIGPNGAGKSTMIKTIVGLYKKNNGKISICGFDLDKAPKEALSTVGAIIENPDMYSHLTGMQNLMIFANMRTKISKEQIMEYVKLVKLENRINDKVKTYSLGMKQRLGLVQALMHNPQLLILDEPTNGLDPVGIIELRNLLKKINIERGTTIFISSHILSEVENICNTIAIIDNGVIVDIKDMKDIKSNETGHFVFDVDDAEGAKNVLMGIFNVNSNIQNNELVVDTNRELIPNINSSFVDNGIRVYQIKYIARSLEDEFIEKTSSYSEQIK